VQTGIQEFQDSWIPAFAGMTQEARRTHLMEIRIHVTSDKSPAMVNPGSEK
jgi:hypothetical protein